ncbi:MMPL family transporter [Paenibacillus rigui]|uniref:MMPL family protein n=1 Tax=Paenibacillus rigui TaxID=554312 RepID=A0A229UX17_9BACL|nr:MMPL family transporter [Paenibacillus rigui]OXM87469.1 MMPL family protein [Paenibacillus rigui]
MGFRWLTFISLRYPRTILLLWIAFFIGFGFHAWKLPDVLKDHGLTPTGGDYAYVEKTMSADFRMSHSPVIVMFEKKRTVSDAVFRQHIAQTLTQAADIKGLSAIQSPLEQQGMLAGRYAYALLSFEQKPYQMKPVLKALQQKLPPSPDIAVTLTGQAVVQEEVNRSSEHDLKQAELIGLPVAFLILWFAFGGLRAAAIPVVTGVAAVAGTMGIMYGIGTRVELSHFVLNVIPMAGLALGIDFALMMVSRFREELRRAPAMVNQAMAMTMRTAGKAVAVSACCVMLGLVGLLWIPLPIFTTVALGAMVVTALSALIALTLLPSLLVLLGPVLEAELRRRPVERSKKHWAIWADFVMRRPKCILAMACLLLLACLLPLARMELAIPDASSLPDRSVSRQAMEAFQKNFQPPESSRVYVLAETASGQALEPRHWREAYAFVQRLERDPGVLRVDSVFSSLGMLKSKQLAVLASGPQHQQAIAPYVPPHRMLIQVTLQGKPDSKAAMAWVRDGPYEMNGSALTYRLGGEVKYQQEIFDAITGHAGSVLLFIIIGNYMVLFLAFRSVLLPIKALMMNFLSLGAAFGVLTWIFQQELPGLEPGRIAVMIPIFIFGLVFGISMDYGVFLLARMAEAYRQTGDNDLAVREGLVSTSRIITSAAAMMIAVTVPFAFGDVIGVRQLGIGIATAIMIDATLIRLMVVPSLMKLLGQWNWWVPKG